MSNKNKIEVNYVDDGFYRLSIWHEHLDWFETSDDFDKSIEIDVESVRSGRLVKVVADDLSGYVGELENYGNDWCW